MALWPRCTYRTAAEAVIDYLRRIPLADPDRDPYLEDWVAAIADDAIRNEPPHM